MSLPTEKTLSENVKAWVEIIGIVIAAIWGIYTFIYQEITKPNSAPVNITMNLQFKKLIPPAKNMINEHAGLIAVEMVATATNPSAREIYLLPSAWIAWGNKFEEANSNDFDGSANLALKSAEGNKMAEKYASISKPHNPDTTDTVASGRLFGDTSLKPNETITRRIVFHVPEKFNVVDIWAGMPSTTAKGSLDAEWKFSENALHKDIFCIDNGNRVLLTDIKDDIPEKCDLQWSTSLASFSLWQ
ncbi:hypothetical protein [Methylomonas sp. MgM2]